MQVLAILSDLTKPNCSESPFFLHKQRPLHLCSSYSLQFPEHTLTFHPPGPGWTVWDRSTRHPLPSEGGQRTWFPSHPPLSFPSHRQLSPLQPSTPLSVSYIFQSQQGMQSKAWCKNTALPYKTHVTAKMCPCPFSPRAAVPSGSLELAHLLIPLTSTSVSDWLMWMGFNNKYVPH